MKSTILQSQIALHIARAQWWTAYANTPDNLARRVQVGGYGSTEFLCHSELVNDAMATADRHLVLAQGCIDTLSSLP